MVHITISTPTIQTGRLRIRPFNDSDANALFAIHSNAEVLRYWDAPAWSEFASAERFIVKCRQIEKEGTGTRVAVERVSDGTFIGWCSLIKWDPIFRSASMGFCFDIAGRLHR